MNRLDDLLKKNDFLEEQIETLTENILRQQQKIEELTNIIQTHLPSRKEFFLWQEGGRKL